jgi:Ice-binding-like
MTKYNGLHAGTALLLASLGAACGNSDVASSADSGNGGDRGSDGATAIDDANSGDGGGGSTDGPTTSDAPVSIDGASGESGSKHTGQPVNLGMAGSYAILAKSAISTVPTSAVTGNVGVSPAAATFITGFSLIADATTVFSTSKQVTGKVYAADYAVPTPSNLTTAVSDMQNAFTDAAGRAPDVTELGAGNIGGKTLTPGVYKWGTGLLIPTTVTLTGSATDVWIFQVAQDLKMSSATNIVLAGGAVSANVFWEVAGAVDVGTTAHLEGVVMSKTAITLQTGASIKGRLLAQTAVSIDGSAVVAP